MRPSSEWQIMPELKIKNIVSSGDNIVFAIEEPEIVGKILWGECRGNEIF